MRRFLTQLLPAVCLLAFSVACSPEAARDRAIANGEAFLKAGRPADAIIEFSNAVGKDPLSGRARLLLADAYVINHEPENALQQYVRAADLLPDDGRAQLEAARYLLMANQFEDARTRAQQLTRKEPKNVDAQILLASALAGLRDPEGAVTQLNEAIQLEPARAQSYTTLGLVQASQGNYDTAKAAFEKAVDMDAKSISARLALATFQWSIGDVDSTRETLRAALALDPKYLITHRALASFYRASGKPSEAEGHLKFVASSSPTSDAQFELADFYTVEGRVAEARSVLDPLSMSDATNLAAKTRLASLAYEQGRRASAHQTLDEVLAKEPNYALALLLKARWLLAEGDIDQALERARAATEASPRMVAAFYTRGLAETRTHRTADAIKSFTEVLRLNPRAALAQVQLSNLHLMRNSVDSAVTLADEAIRNAPRNLDAYLARIRAWVARGDLDHARPELAAIAKQFPNLASVSAVEGRLYMRTGDLAAARVALDRTMQLDPRSMEALDALTALDLQQNRIEDARSRLANRIDAGDETPAVLLLAARTFLAAGDRARAEALLRKSIVRDPLETANYGLLGRLLQEGNRLEAAKSEFEAAAKNEPLNLPARLMLGMLAHARGDTEQAKFWYADALRIEPRAALAANNLASIYADAGDNLDVAQKLAENALEQWPGAAEFQDTLGWVYYRRQLGGQAINRFQQSIATDPSNPVYHYHLGLAYFRNGDRDRARTALQRALELNPGFSDASQALATMGR